MVHARVAVMFAVSACLWGVGLGCDGGGSAGPADPDAPGGGQDDATSEDDPMGAEASCEGQGACDAEGLCAAYPCGGRAARFNHFGCARVACQRDEDCPATEACFSIAYDRLCEPSATSCTERDGACVCTGADDCDGILDAHCLPVEFYPPQQYCDPGRFSCEDLQPWADGLRRAAAQSDAALAVALESCAGDAEATARECP